MPNSNRFNILSISIFSKISLSIYQYFPKSSYRYQYFPKSHYRYRYQYFPKSPYRYWYFYRYRYSQKNLIDILSISIFSQKVSIFHRYFEKCRYIDNRYRYFIKKTWKNHKSAEKNDFLADIFKNVLIDIDIIISDIFKKVSNESLLTTITSRASGDAKKVKKSFLISVKYVAS